LLSHEIDVLTGFTGIEQQKFEFIIAGEEFFVGFNQVL
jgi:hypothetical protein